MSTTATGPELPELAAGTPKFIHQQVKDMEKLISRIEKEDSYEIFRTDLDPIEKLKGTEGAQGDEQNAGDANRSGFGWVAAGRGRKAAFSTGGGGGGVGSGDGAPQSSDRNQAGSPARGDGGTGDAGRGQPSRRRPRKGSSVAVNEGEPAAAVAGADAPTPARPSAYTAVEDAVDVNSEGKADGEGNPATTGQNGVLLKEPQHPVTPKMPPINLPQIRERFVRGCYVPAPGSYLVQSQEAVPTGVEPSGVQAPLLTAGQDGSKPPPSTAESKSSPTAAAAAPTTKTETTGGSAAVAGANSKRPRKRPSTSRSGSSSPPLPSQPPKQEATEVVAKSPAPATASGNAVMKTASKPTGKTWSSPSPQTRPTPVLPLTRDSGRLGGAAKLTFDYEPLLDWAGLRADIAGMVGRMVQWAEDWKAEREQEKNQRRQRRRRRRCRADGGSGGGGGTGGDAKGKAQEAGGEGEAEEEEDDEEGEEHVQQNLEDTKRFLANADDLYSKHLERAEREVS